MDLINRNMLNAVMTTNTVAKQDRIASGNLAGLREPSAVLSQEQVPPQVKPLSEQPYKAIASRAGRLAVISGSLASCDSFLATCWFSSEFSTASTSTRTTFGTSTRNGTVSTGDDYNHRKTDHPDHQSTDDRDGNRDRIRVKRVATFDLSAN